MKRIHLLRVDAPLSTFEPLLRAAEQAGLRLGWLRLDAADGLPQDIPAELKQAADVGALRAVHSSAAGTVGVKPRRGAPVLRDLLREYFLGCTAVLLAAEETALLQPEDAPVPRLAAAGVGSWSVTVSGDFAHLLATEQLLSRMRRPRPWD